MPVCEDPVKILTQAVVGVVHARQPVSQTLRYRGYHVDVFGASLRVRGGGLSLAGALKRRLDS